VTAEDADGWKSWLVSNEKLAPATVSRRIVAARTMWKAAMRWNLAANNPFSGVKAGLQSNDARKYFVSRVVIDRVIEEAADTEWKALIALSRFGGLRCPSEHLSLTWADVDFHLGRLHVRSPKTEHHEGGASRTVPMFPELREHLQRLYDEAPEGTTFVISGTRDTAVNLRTQFQRIIRRAGYTPWPRLWQNLRSSRESELMREYDLATVCRWIGNSPEVAARHYATSVDLNADFKKAVANVAQNQAQSASVSDCIPPSPTPDTPILPLETSPDEHIHISDGPEWSRTIDLVVISDAL